MKFHPADPHVLLSAGWDNTVCVWDTRLRSGAVRSIHGPHVCGDALDVEPSGGAEVLTGAYSSEDQLQVWDLGSGALIQTLAWGPPSSGR